MMLALVEQLPRREKWPAMRMSLSYVKPETRRVTHTRKERPVCWHGLPSGADRHENPVM